MKLNSSQTVRDIAVHYPVTVRVFESLGIDYCCGGRRSLQEACEKASVNLAETLQLLSSADELSSKEGSNWADTRILELTQHIVEQHHSYVRRESPRLIAMLDKVVTCHGADHQELKSIQEMFVAMVDELAMHMMKEENLLFPHLVKLEEAVRQGSPMPHASFGSVEDPISRMMADHDDAGALTVHIRDLSNDFKVPVGACPTYRGLYQGLEEFERDLHRHVHLENNILFPKAIEIERKESANIRA